MDTVKMTKLWGFGASGLRASACLRPIICPRRRNCIGNPRRHIRILGRTIWANETSPQRQKVEDAPGQARCFPLGHGRSDYASHSEKRRFSNGQQGHCVSREMLCGSASRTASIKGGVWLAHIHPGPKRTWSIFDKPEL